MGMLVYWTGRLDWRDWYPVQPSWWLDSGADGIQDTGDRRQLEQPKPQPSFNASSARAVPCVQIAVGQISVTGQPRATAIEGCSAVVPFSKRRGYTRAVREAIVTRRWSKAAASASASASLVEDAGMHYIRFLKAPRLDPTLSSKDRLCVVTKVAITSDLGEAFLSADLPLLVELEASSSSSSTDQVPKRYSKALAPPREVLWKGSLGIRALDIRIDLSNEEKAYYASRNVRLCVHAKDDELDAEDLIAHLSGFASGCDDGTRGRVVAVRSMDFNLDYKVLEGVHTSSGLRLSERKLTAEGQELHIWEELGESIARHIWDAGLVLSAYLASMSPLKRNRKRGKSDASILSVAPRIKTLETALGKEELRVLELGSGCGIVGISLATYFPNAASVVLTDLPEASEILDHNLAAATLKLPNLSPKLTTQNLDWSSPLPENVKGQTWDLVIVADCTYNPDVVPDLVHTLISVGKCNSEVLVLLAMKVRHESEMVFFDLMKEGGFRIKENIAIKLPLLGLDMEEMIEIYLFSFSGLSI
ncbi:hypothetical protein B7463_g10977, partial [Scytalidium lignicola]